MRKLENLDFISKLFDGRVVLGKKEQLTERLSVVPVYKVKVTFLNLSTDLKNTAGDGSSGSVHITPICLLQVLDDSLIVLPLEEKPVKEDITDWIPNIMSNIDLSNVLKNIKLN